MSEGKNVIFGKVVAMQNESDYLKIVIDSDGKYTIVTRLPRWEIEVELGREYYIEYVAVIGGKTEYYHAAIDDFIVYKYDGCYLLSAVPYRAEPSEPGMIELCTQMQEI